MTSCVHDLTRQNGLITIVYQRFLLTGIMPSSLENPQSPPPMVVRITDLEFNKKYFNLASALGYKLLEIDFDWIIIDAI